MITSKGTKYVPEKCSRPLAFLRCNQQASPAPPRKARINTRKNELLGSKTYGSSRFDELLCWFGDLSAGAVRNSQRSLVLSCELEWNRMRYLQFRDTACRIS